jgi:diguanylate cyclase (GGDEF)-like protein
MSPRRPVTQSTVSARKRPPRLVQLFSILTALGVAAAAALIFVIVEQADKDQARLHATQSALLAARGVVAPSLRESDLAGSVARTRRRELDRVVRNRVVHDSVQAASVYRADGTRAYATARGAPGGAPTRELLHDALAGSVVSETVRAANGTRILRTYVPITRKDAGVAGVIRIDQSAEALAATGHRSLLVAAVLEGLLLLLFISLVPVLARASSRIEDQLVELERIATHDELTGLPNRLGFRRAVDAALRSFQSGAVLLVDLDGFSEINSSLGPQRSDQLLVEAGARLQREVAAGDVFLARLGDDEFGVLCPSADEGGAEWLARHLRHSFAAPFVVDGIRISVDLDVGVALFPSHGTDAETLLRHATAALRAAKAEGRTSVQVYDPELRASHLRRFEVVAEVRDALAAGQLCVHYQPQIDLLTRRIRGAEALIRWQHPERGLITASEFIAQCERSELGQELRRFVLAETARQWQQWHWAGVDLEIAVNLSAVDILDPALPEEIEDTLKRYGVPAWNFVLEVTERTLIGDERRAHQVADELSRIGVRLAVDDFGTGYSSLAGLRWFPIHQVKLDHSLFADVPGDEAAEAIVGGCVEIVHGLNALVIAEGIETREQLHFASAVGCDIVQGYLVGHPTSPEVFLEMLDARVLVPLPLEVA